MPLLTKTYLHLVSMKHFWIVMLCLISFPLFGQRERNNIYILDCSNSMVTTNKIFEPTLEYLHRDILELPTNSMVTIIPFQGDVFNKAIIHCTREKIDWPKFINQVTPLTQQLGGTNICGAWEKGLQYIDPNKDNYIYLLTDGEDNKKGTPEVCTLIRQWCDYAKEHNTFGFFVALTEEAIDPRIRQVVDECPSMFMPNAGVPVNVIGSFEKSEMNLNTIDCQNVKIPFSAAGLFEATAQSSDSNIVVSIVGNNIADGKAVFNFKTEGDLELRPHDFDVWVHVDGKNVTILNPDILLHVRNIPERSLILPSEEPMLGEVEWYDSFLLMNAKKMDTLIYDLNPIFNESAFETEAHLKLELVETTTDNQNHQTGMEAEILFNGKPCPNGRMDIDPGNPAVISIIPHKKSIEGMHYYTLSYLKHSARNLETINQEPYADYKLTLRYSYDEGINPLKLITYIVIGLILLLLLLWTCIIKPLNYKTFRLYSLTVSEPYFNSIPINGAIRIVFTNQPKKQGALEKFFKGKVIYEVNDVWEKEWTLEPYDNSAMMVCLDYYVKPADLPLEIGIDYTLIPESNPQNKAKITIS